MNFEPVPEGRGFPLERRHCPAHFQERIAQVGGRNRYGQPNYRLAWAQTETMIQGGEWEADGDRHVGYRPVYVSDGLPHWVLLKWVDAGKCIEMPFLPAQGPASWYQENRCPKTGLQLLGEYPHHGSYKVALPLVAKWFDGGELRVVAYPLDTEIVNMMVPVIQASMLLTMEAANRFMKDESERDEADWARICEDVYMDIKLSPSAAASQWIEDKLRKMERSFNAANIMRLQRNRNLHQARVSQSIYPV